MMKFRLGAILIAVLIPVTLTTPASSNAHIGKGRRGGATCGAASDYLVGYTTSKDSNIRGSRASIQFQNPDLCGSDIDGDSDSVGVVDGTGEVGR